MLGIIALFDLLIRFKRPLLLKFYFISFVAFMVGVNVFIFLGLTSPAILVILNILRSFSVVFLILIMNSLYISAKKNWVYLSVALISGIAVYMSIDLILHYDTLGVSVNLPANDTKIFVYLNNSLQYLLPYRVITLLLVLLTTSRLTFLILKNSSTANIYFKQIIKWTYPLLSIGMLQLILFLISLIFNINGRILNGIVIFITAYSFLIILYRPVF